MDDGSRRSVMIKENGQRERAVTWRHIQKLYVVKESEFLRVCEVCEFCPEIFCINLKVLVCGACANGTIFSIPRESQRERRS